MNDRQKLERMVVALTVVGTLALGVGVGYRVGGAANANAPQETAIHLHGDSACIRASILSNSKIVVADVKQFDVQNNLFVEGSGIIKQDGTAFYHTYTDKNGNKITVPLPTGSGK